MANKPPFTSVWARETPPRRGRDQPALSRGQIVRAALEILDAEGMEALSMRKLGAKLGAGATSLYWHVANKDELLELCLDEVLAEARVPGPQGERSWRDAAAVFAYGMRQTMLRHPWVAPLLGVLPSFGPNALAVTAALTVAFERAGFTGRILHYATGAVVSYTLGATTPEVSWLNMVAGSDVSADERLDTLRKQVEVAAADYPDLLARHRAQDYSDMGITKSLTFDFGLVALLDGLEVRLRHHLDEAGPPPQSAPPSSPTEDAAAGRG
ncbi:TetR/AcrR family transcriptional regulator C-terminal domain-containing protein [Sphaerisporangium sp. NPDC051011]|uniref:TetR/AcrR family transcriptional regulator C-terminal domain-containing protein n=1 Tax=Sphaerisporangium sp. NPDC051011 TaxID=3155792 RepID=UPI0033CD077A